MIVRRMRVAYDNYSLHTVLAEKLRLEKEHEDRKYEIQQKMGGKFYLVWYDLREIPDIDPTSLLEVPEYPGYNRVAEREEYLRIVHENERRVRQFVDDNVVRAGLLRGKLGS